MPTAAFSLPVAAAGCPAHPARRQQDVAEQQGGREFHGLRCVGPDEEERLGLVPAVAAISCQHSLGQLVVLVHQGLQHDGQSLLELGWSDAAADLRGSTLQSPVNGHETMSQ